MVTIDKLNTESNWASEKFNNLAIKSGKLIKRFIRTMTTLSKKINESIASASVDKAEAKAIYRLTWNEEITEEVVLLSHKKSTIKRILESEEKTILSVQDTTELNYTGHKKTTGLGEYGQDIRQSMEKVTIYTSDQLRKKRVTSG